MNVYLCLHISRYKQRKGPLPPCIFTACIPKCYTPRDSIIKQFTSWLFGFQSLYNLMPGRYPLFFLASPICYSARVLCSYLFFPPLVLLHSSDWFKVNNFSLLYRHFTFQVFSQCLNWLVELVSLAWLSWPSYLVLELWIFHTVIYLSSLGKNKMQLGCTRVD